jgi:FtsP/CotA-like multicopper oxidase with cupredoxin domain
MAPKWTSCLLVAVLLSCILSFGFNYRALFASPNLFQNSQPEFSNEDIASEPGVSIPLHPERHISRAPKTIRLQWNVTQGYRSPDGVRKLVYLINGETLSAFMCELTADECQGAFPGPTIEARSGDTFVVEISNLIEEEGVAIHWHGLHMRGEKTQAHVILRFSTDYFPWA